MGVPKQEKASVEGEKEEEEGEKEEVEKEEMEEEKEVEEKEKEEKKEKEKKKVLTTEEKKEGRGQIRSHPLELASGYQLLLSG